MIDGDTDPETLHGATFSLARLVMKTENYESFRIYNPGKESTEKTTTAFYGKEDRNKAAK